MEHFLVLLEMLIHRSAELVDNVEVKGAEVRVVAFVGVGLVDVDHLHACALSRRGPIGQKVELIYSAREGLIHPN